MQKVDCINAPRLLIFCYFKHFLIGKENQIKRQDTLRGKAYLLSSPISLFSFIKIIKLIESIVTKFLSSGN